MSMNENQRVEKTFDPAKQAGPMIGDGGWRPTGDQPEYPRNPPRPTWTNDNYPGDLYADRMKVLADQLHLQIPDGEGVTEHEVKQALARGETLVVEVNGTSMNLRFEGLDLVSDGGSFKVDGLKVEGNNETEEDDGSE